METLSGALVTSVIECAGCGMILPLQHILQPVQFPRVLFLFLTYLIPRLFFLIVIFKLQNRGSVTVCLQPSEHFFPVIDITLKTIGVDELYTKNALDNI